jgi:biotin carboxylase
LRQSPHIPETGLRSRTYQDRAPKRTRNEYWLATEARLRDDFNITGIRGHQIDAIRRKSEMKKRFRQAGVTVAPGRVVHDLAEARAFIAETGYPVVAKPDAGVGALDTFRLDSDADLAALFASALGDEGYIFRSEDMARVAEITDFIHATT